MDDRRRRSYQSPITGGLQLEPEPDDESQRLLDHDEFEIETFRGGDFAGANLSGKTFFRCELLKLSAKEVNLRDCVFENCLFAGCDLTMAVIAGASFRDVEFKDCKLMGVDWSQVAGLRFSASFLRCILSYGSFIDLRMKKIKIISCRAHETNFAGADLTGADFTDTDLHGARFVGTNLTGADLSKASNYEINPSDNTLRKTRYSPEAALALAERMGVVVPDR